MLLVILVPDLLAVQRIAFFEGNVHILYVVELAQDCTILLLTYTLGNPEKFKVTRCNVQFGKIEAYGKKHVVWGFRKRPQDVVNIPRSFRQPRLAQSNHHPLYVGFILK